MRVKNPIFTFTILVFLFAILLYVILGFWGLGAILWIFGVYIILIVSSLILKKLKVKNRNLIEWTLIFLFILSHFLYYLNWDVSSEICFNDNENPFVSKNQSFIIVFGIENQPKLENNYFSNNEIQIPENGILLTSSNKEEFKQRYKFPIVGTGNKFKTSHFEQYACYGKQNHKFNYVVGTISNQRDIDYEYRDSIGDILCKKLNKEEIHSNLKSGYKEGNYLDQKEVLINYANLTKLPEGILELKNLEYLNIHSNKLNKIPKDITNFPKLKKLSIGYNNIKQIPDWIGSIENLKSLSVNGNNLKTLPDTLLTLRKLDYLLIRENDFDQLKIEEIIKPFKDKGVQVQFE